MTHTSTELELYEQWRDDYALTYEPNYDEHLEADCRAAFSAGMQAARRAQVVNGKGWCGSGTSMIDGHDVAAPVQLPEPRWHSPVPGDAAHFPYYTPEDVRQLLAAHGIK